MRRLCTYEWQTKLLVHVHAMRKLGSSVKISGLTDFEATHAKLEYRYGVVPISNEGFAHPSARLRRSKIKLLQ
jgi:hypothetical protein